MSHERPDLSTVPRFLWFTDAPTLLCCRVSYVRYAVLVVQEGRGCWKNQPRRVRRHREGIFADGEGVDQDGKQGAGHCLSRGRSGMMDVVQVLSILTGQVSRSILSE